MVTLSILPFALTVAMRIFYTILFSIYKACLPCHRDSLEPSSASAHQAILGFWLPVQAPIIETLPQFFSSLITVCSHYVQHSAESAMGLETHNIETALAQCRTVHFAGVARRGRCRGSSRGRRKGKENRRVKRQKWGILQQNPMDLSIVLEAQWQCRLDNCCSCSVVTSPSKKVRGYVSRCSFPTKKKKSESLLTAQR